VKGEFFDGIVNGIFADILCQNAGHVHGHHKDPYGHAGEKVSVGSYWIL
jgi:hypothetical protein